MNKEDENLFFCPTNTPSSKNSRQFARGRLLPSKATTRWRKETEGWWRDNRDEFRNIAFKKKKPLKVEFHFVRKSKHKFDFVNPLQTVQDEMTKFDWIDDDNVEELIPFPAEMNGSFYTYDKDNPGVYFKIIE